jgi:Cytochrome c oxidase subunit IIa family
MNSKESDEAFDQSFKPKGAVAFFALLVILGMFIWFGIYFLMLSRI